MGRTIGQTSIIRLTEDSYEKFEEITRISQEVEWKDKDINKVYNYKWVIGLERSHFGRDSKIEINAVVRKKSMQLLKNESANCITTLIKNTTR